MVSQPHSALARTERYLSRALAALREGNLAQATEQLDYALGAVAVAGDRQTRLIEQAKETATYLEGCDSTRAENHALALRRAVTHAEDPA